MTSSIFIGLANCPDIGLHSSSCLSIFSQSKSNLGELRELHSVCLRNQTVVALVRWDIQHDQYLLLVRDTLCLRSSSIESRCSYKDHRTPPWDSKPYQTNHDYYVIMVARLAFLIVFEVPPSSSRFVQCSFSSCLE